MRIGILGGTFDPPHEAHLELARTAIANLELDEVLFVPTSRSPFKTNIPETGRKHRFNMAELAIHGQDQMSISDIEVTRPGPSYTIDTIEELSMSRRAAYWLILGSDALSKFADWKQPERIVKLCRLAVATRAQTSPEQAKLALPLEMRESLDFLEMPPINISSSRIRHMIQTGGNPERWLAPQVWEYIKKERLYRKND